MNTRRIVVWLVIIVAGLVGLATPAQAQIGDPLTLAASGVLVPFLSANGDVSLLEVASPVGANEDAHMFFFNQNCARFQVVDSVGLPLTANDVGFVNIATLGLPLTNAGLVTLAAADQSGFFLEPLKNPVHARMYIFNTVSGRSTVLEPIVLDVAEFPGAPHTWSPLRTGATFYAPQETAVVKSRVILVCPLNTIQDAAGGGAFPTTLFPTITPPFPDEFVLNQLRARIYDTNEVFLRDVRTTCQCVREDSVLGISTVYAMPEAALGTYTELESNNFLAKGNIPFVGYVSVFTVNSAINNFAHRMSNGSRLSLQGTVTAER